MSKKESNYQKQTGQIEIEIWNLILHSQKSKTETKQHQLSQISDRRWKYGNAPKKSFVNRQSKADRKLLPGKWVEKSVTNC